MKRFFLTNLSVVIVLWLLLIPVKDTYSQSSSSTVVINEIHPNPSSGSEWIELYLPMSSIVSSLDLAGWSLWDELSQSNLIYQFVDQQLITGSYLVIEIQNKLNNGGDGVLLKNAGDSIIDQMSYSSSQTGISWARTPNGTGDFVLSPPSPNAANLTPTPTSAPTPSPSVVPPTPTVTFTPLPSTNSILLSEIMACPSEGREWVELVSTSNESINLDNWTLWDSQNKIYLFSQETITPQGFVTVDIYQKLNNSGDEVTLKEPGGNSIATMSYLGCTTDHSWIYHNGTWVETDTPTRNTINSLSSLPTPSPSLTNTPDSSPPGKKDPSAKQPVISTPSPTTFQPPIDLRKIQLSSTATSATTTAAHPSTGNFIFKPNYPQKNRFISVIIGGLTLLCTGAYGLYDQYQK